MTATKDSSNIYHTSADVEFILLDEYRRRGETLRDFAKLNSFVSTHGTRIRDLLAKIKNDGKTVLGYGASTKGNVVLQNCSLSRDHIPFIGDITPSKNGKFTPGSKIPIISMEAAHAMRPDYFLVLPWSFKADIIVREADFLQRGGKFIFPLPDIEIYG